MKRLPTKVHLDLVIRDWLKAEAQRLGCSMSAMVRRLTLAEMERHRK